MTARVRAFALGLALVPSLAASLLVAPRPASAQDDPAITAEARKRFLEGVKLFDEKKYELARASFVQAYALKKHPDVLLNLAQSELLSGHPFDAANHFKEFLRDPAAASHPKRGDAERGLNDARSKIGRIQITVDVADADILLDGKKIGSSPMGEAVDVAPGPHVTEARKAGKTAKEGVIATEGKIIVSNLSLGGGGPAVVPPPPPRDEPKNPVPKDEPTPKDESKPTDVAKTEEPPPAGGGHENFLDWGKRSPIAWVGGGLFVVGLGGGLVFSASAGSAQSTIDSLTAKIKTAAAADAALNTRQRVYPCEAPIQKTNNDYPRACSDLKSSIDQKSTDNTLATVGFVTMGVGAAVVIGGYFLTRTSGEQAAASRTKEAPRPSFAISPVIGPQLTGLGASGSF